MTHIRMILKHLCLSDMLDIIQSKITCFWGYIMLPLLCSLSLISPNFYVKLINFSQIWPGAFSQNCWKKPWLPLISWLHHTLSCSSSVLFSKEDNEFRKRCAKLRRHFFWASTTPLKIYGYIQYNLSKEATQKKSPNEFSRLIIA